MQRRRHPHYARRTAAFSYGLIAAAIACLLLGQIARRTALRDFETVLDVGFCLFFIGAIVRWFTTGEATDCPECGRRLMPDDGRDATDPLSFTCPDCNIAWNVDAAESVADSDD